jgi:predicted MPP superfamily phosphohydrolase
VYAVFGNHDIHDSKTWPPALLASKIPVLQNEARQVDCSAGKFWISGLQDLWFQHANIPATLSQVTNSDPVIMAMHNPDSFAKMDDKVALSVAGHTHGGQIRLPFIGAVAEVVPSRYGLRYVYGHVREDGRDLIVTSGLGCTGLPLRFLNPPEIGIVTLKGVKPYPSGVHKPE